MLIYTSLYIQWTDDGNLKITGVQGRYYIPLLPLIGLVIGNLVKTKNEYREDDMTKVKSRSGITNIFNIVISDCICFLKKKGRKTKNEKSFNLWNI